MKLKKKPLIYQKWSQLSQRERKFVKTKKKKLKKQRIGWHRGREQNNSTEKNRNHVFVSNPLH